MSTDLNATVFMATLRPLGVPVPVRELLFARAALGRQWRFDWAWPGRRVALEVEGGAWQSGRHNRAAGFLGDIEKYNAAAVLGWRLLRTTPADLIRHPTIEAIRAVLALPHPLPAAGCPQCEGVGCCIVAPRKKSPSASPVLVACDCCLKP